jgi:hypothetical protein
MAKTNIDTLHIFNSYCFLFMSSHISKLLFLEKTFHMTGSNPDLICMQIFSTANCKDGLNNVWDNARIFRFCMCDICLQVSTFICKASCSNKHCGSRVTASRQTVPQFVYLRTERNEI